MSWICHSNVVFGVVSWKRQSCSEYGFIWNNQCDCSDSFLDVDFFSCLHSTRRRKTHRSSVLANYSYSVDLDYSFDSWHDHPVRLSYTSKIKKSRFLSPRKAKKVSKMGTILSMLVIFTFIVFGVLFYEGQWWPGLEMSVCAMVIPLLGFCIGFLFATGGKLLLAFLVQRGHVKWIEPLAVKVSKNAIFWFIKQDFK